MLPEPGDGEAVKIVAAELQVVPLHPSDGELVQIDGVPDLDHVQLFQLLRHVSHVPSEHHHPS